MARSTVLLALVAFLGTHPASAQGPYGMRTGNDVLSVCTGSHTNEQLMCVSWFAGLAAGIQSVLVLTGSRRLCLPENSNVGQYRDVVLAYLRTNPERRHLLAGPLAVVALMRAFPCPDSN
jgi:hypothetical protein